MVKKPTKTDPLTAARARVAALEQKAARQKALEASKAAVTKAREDYLKLRKMKK